MHNRVLALWVAGIFGFSAAAIAQTPPPSTTGTKFDGTYAFASGTTLNETSTNYNGHLIRCRTPPKAGPLAVVSGQAQGLAA